MKELAAIVEAYHKAGANGQRSAIATVVQVIGSSYRSAGARMLVTENGEITGAISGGCLEGDALKKALYAIENKTNRIVIYDTTDESDAALGIQLGCNGTVYILFEPIDAEQENNPIHLIEQAIKFRKPGVLLTVFSKDLNAMQKGTSFVLNSNAITGDSEFAEDALQALKSNQSTFKEMGRQTIFIEVIQPPISLIIAGGGNDIMPLAIIANQLGWNITIIDSRPGYAIKSRFPNAEVKTGSAEHALDDIPTDSRTAILLMSHNYNYDLAVLKQAVKKENFYIGILGPKTKRDKMITELGADGGKAKVHGPMGLDIGSETAADIALSILAEIQSELNKKSAEPLKDKAQSIHERPNQNVAA